jgi:uncharacterized protein with PhoU and TrkA domain
VELAYSMQELFVAGRLLGAVSLLTALGTTVIVALRGARRITEGARPIVVSEPLLNSR